MKSSIMPNGMNKTRFKIRNLGVIVNPAAGAGNDAIEKIAKRAIKIFRNCNIIRPELGEGREFTIRIAKKNRKQC
jgi:hypothetical protein